MYNTVKYHLVFLVIMATFITGCKKDNLPVLTTTLVSDITPATAKSGGRIIDPGSSDVISYGVCWSTTENPTTSDPKTSDLIGSGQFESSISGLSAGTTYHVRAYAVNSVGTAYGEDLTFLTLGQVPSTVTQPATNLAVSSATFNGTVNPNHLSTTVSFEYGTTTSYGTTTPANQSPVTGNSALIVSAFITTLNPGTTYHFRVKSVNSLGTVYGNDLTFTTLGQAPACVTLASTNTLTNGATINGTVNANLLYTTVSFEYGPTTSYGSTASATPSLVTGNSITTTSANITGLSPAAVYHYRIKAVNSLGTSYGNDMVFTTSLTDIEGNIYKTIKIGNQVWMAENLKTTKYRNGNLIGTTTPLNLDITLETEPKYQWVYAGNVSNADIYGRLYTWYAVTDSRNVCPAGWHVPSNDEWTALLTYLGGTVGAGGKLKESGTAHWLTPNTGATNETGFTALPGGSRHFNGNSNFIGSFGYYWSSTQRLYTSGMFFYTKNDIGDADTGSAAMAYGFSVRCLKDY